MTSSLRVVSTDRQTAIAGGTFAAAFSVGIALVGDQAGAFADSDGAFREHFDSASRRTADLVGSFLLVVASITFLVFASLHSSRIDGDAGRARLLAVVSRSAGTLAAVGVFVAALCFATVPASLSFGTLTDDPGLDVGQAVLPQLGYVALVGSMFSAAALIGAVSLSEISGRWLRRAGYPIAVLLAVGSPGVSPTVLLAVWVALVCVSRWRAEAQA